MREPTIVAGCLNCNQFFLHQGDCWGDKYLDPRLRPYTRYGHPAPCFEDLRPIVIRYWQPTLDEFNDI